eukprot:gene11696-15614_t
MKKFIGLLVVGLVGIVVILADGMPLSIVRHRWQEVITESNHAALRPGSVYDILTHFEQNFGLARPKFNYLSDRPSAELAAAGEGWLFRTEPSHRSFFDRRHAGGLPHPVGLL